MWLTRRWVADQGCGYEVDLFSAGRWDVVLVHQREDAVTDLLEFRFRFRGTLSLLLALCSLLLLLFAGDDPPGCTPTADGMLFRGLFA